jgi:hypothetical protein
MIPDLIVSLDHGVRVLVDARSIFVADTASGTIRYITRCPPFSVPSRLLPYWFMSPGGIA